MSNFSSRSLVKRIENSKGAESETLVAHDPKYLKPDDFSDISLEVVEIFKKMTIHNVLDEKMLTIANELFSYQGFDADNIYKALALVMKKKNIDMDMFVGDLSMMLVIQHLRGNVHEKHLKNFTPEAKRLINELYTRWNIARNVTGKDRFSVTLPRIAACYPYQSAQVAKAIKKDFTGPFNSGLLPDCMKSVSFASIIPQNTEYGTILELAYNLFTSDQTYTLQKKSNVTSRDELTALYNSQMKYTRIGVESSVVSNQETRKYYIKELGLLAPDVIKVIHTVVGANNYSTKTIVAEGIIVTEASNMITASKPALTTADERKPLNKFLARVRKPQEKPSGSKRQPVVEEEYEDIAKGPDQEDSEA